MKAREYTDDDRIRDALGCMTSLVKLKPEPYMHMILVLDDCLLKIRDLTAQPNILPTSVPFLHGYAPVSPSWVWVS